MTKPCPDFVGSKQFPDKPKSLLALVLAACAQLILGVRRVSGTVPLRPEPSERVVQLLRGHAVAEAQTHIACLHARGNRQSVEVAADILVEGKDCGRITARTSPPKVCQRP